MTNCMVLEWPGRWRVGGLSVLLALPLLPTLPLLWVALLSSDRFTLGGETFGHAISNSVIVALMVALGSFALGLPVGVLNSLYDYRGRRLLMSLSLIPPLRSSGRSAGGGSWSIAPDPYCPSSRAILVVC